VDSEDDYCLLDLRFDEKFDYRTYLGHDVEERLQHCIMGRVSVSEYLTHQTRYEVLSCVPSLD